MQHAALDLQDRVLRKDGDSVRGGDGSVSGLHNGHRGAFANDFGQGAVVIRVQMLDQYKGHAAISRHLREKRPEGVNTASRCADADDQMVSALCAIIDWGATRRVLRSRW